jgi:hypothetical protein
MVVTLRAVARARSSVFQRITNALRRIPGRSSLVFRGFSKFAPDAVAGPLHFECEHLPLGLLPLTSSQAKSGATTIFVNELDAGSFKCPSNNL